MSDPSTITLPHKPGQEEPRVDPAAKIEQYRPDLSIVLPSHIRADTWMRVAISATRKDPKLYLACQQSPDTMMAALYNAARLGLEPGTDQFYLTPRKNKQGKQEVLGIVGYQGEVELIYRAGAVSSVIVELVHAGDRFEYVAGFHDRPVLHADWFGDRGAVIGAYAYCNMKDGAVSKVVVVGDTRIKRAMSASAMSGSATSPWKTDYGAMVMKTAAHDMQKWVPTSAEYREQLREDARSGNGATQGKTTERLDQFTPPPGVVDGEVISTAEGVSRDQLEQINTWFRDRKFGSIDKLSYVSALAQRSDLVSVDGLTEDEASVVVALLERFAKTDDPLTALQEASAEWYERSRDPKESN